MNVLVISSLNLDMEYSIPRSFIMTFATLSEAKEALKAQSSLWHPWPGSVSARNTACHTEAELDLEPCPVADQDFLAREGDVGGEKQLVFACGHDPDDKPHRALQSLRVGQQCLVTTKLLNIRHLTKFYQLYIVKITH